MSVPDRLYLEVWPEQAGRDDTIYYEPTGYGINQRGNASEIHVYERVEDGERALTDAQRIAELEEALTWCGGSWSFSPGGEAHEGWKRIVLPLLERRHRSGPIEEGSNDEHK